MIKIKFNETISMIQITNSTEFDDNLSNYLVNYLSDEVGIDAFLYEKKKYCEKFIMNTSTLFNLMKDISFEDFLEDE